MTMPPPPDETTEVRMLLDKQTEILALIAEHFTIVDVPVAIHIPEKRMLKCNHCGQHVTWVTRHLAERHDMDVEVWRLPGWAILEALW